MAYYLLVERSRVSDRLEETLLSPMPKELLARRLKALKPLQNPLDSQNPLWYNLLDMSKYLTKYLGLAPEEWMGLIHISETSYLPPCCAVISELRDSIIVLATTRESWAIEHFLERFESAKGYHEFDFDNFPELMKLVEATS